MLSKTKKYKCKVEGCNREEVILSKGKCSYHRMLELREEKVVKKDNSLNDFFDKQIQILKKHPYSEVSGKYIPNPSKINIAHILPKRKSGGFPSLREDKDNILFLTWQEHHDFDKLLDNREFEELESLFPDVMDRIKELLNKAKEKNKLYYQLKNYLKL